MSQAQNAPARAAGDNPAVAEIRPHATSQSANEADKYKTLSGFENREAELGRSMSILLKMLGNQAGYQHEMNDPLVKAHLLAMQYAKNKGEWREFVEHDIRTMEPITRFMKKIIDKSGNPEMALIGLFDRTACHYALALTSTGEGRSRTWKSPFGHVLAQCRKIGQFDLTEQEIHENWTVPRLLGYAATMGVKIKVSPWRDDGMITCELVD